MYNIEKVVLHVKLTFQICPNIAQCGCGGHFYHHNVVLVIFNYLHYYIIFTNYKTQFSVIVCSDTCLKIWVHTF